MAVSSPVLKTKLYRPPMTGDLVHRTELIKELNRHKDLPLTLVSAPAGYGKSFIISQWIQEIQVKYAWISMDDDHNIAHNFLNYLLAAIRLTYPDALLSVDAHVKGAELPPIQELAYEFINELDIINDEFVIVLDDYHVIKNTEIHDFINTLLEYPPQNVHLVITTRIDPPLMINHLRAYGRIHELRVNALSFTKEEIAKLYTENLKVDLRPETIDHLFEKTEGWVVGLRLAYLFAIDADDVNRALLELKGEIRLITSFILEETLSKQSPQTLQLLLSTAILNRFNADIIEAINKKDESDIIDGEAFIKKLSQANLFLISLDQNNSWFRFHHLFRDLLVSQLKKYQFSDEVVEDMHLRAANWFESNNLIDEAIEHYVACDKLSACVELIEKRGYNIFEVIGVHQAKHWIEKLPEEMINKSPSLLILKAWIAYGSLRLELIPPIIEKVDKLLEVEKATPIISVQIDFFKGNFAYWMGDTSLSIQLLNQALTHMETLPAYLEGNIELVLNMARQRNGACEELILEHDDKLNNIKPDEGAILPYIYASASFIHFLCGKVREVTAYLQNMSASAKKYDDQYLLVWSHFLEGIANLQLFKLPEALTGMSYTLKNKFNLDFRAVLDTFAALALIHELKGETSESKAFQNRMEDYVNQLGDAGSKDIFLSSKARTALVRRDISTAFQWAKEFNETPTFEGTFFWVEVPWITKAKVLLQEGSNNSISNAEKLLLELKELADSSNLIFYNIEISMLLAVVYEKQGNISDADELMVQVLKEANDQQVIRPLVESGNLILAMLERLKEKNIELKFIDQVIGQFVDEDVEKEHSLQNSTNGLKSSLVPHKALLSTRELEVLSFVTNGFRNKEIAHKLFVSEVTIKKHLYNIFKKLNVNNRINMVQKAKELEIIPGH